MSLCFRRRTLLHWMKTSEKSTVKTQKIIARTTINVCVYWHLHMLLAILWGLQNHFSQFILGLRDLPFMKSPFQWEEGSKIEEKVITHEKFYLYRQTKNLVSYKILTIRITLFRCKRAMIWEGSKYRKIMIMSFMDGPFTSFVILLL